MILMPTPMQSAISLNRGPGLGWAGLDDEVTRYTIAARDTVGGVVGTMLSGGEVAPFSSQSPKQEPPPQQASKCGLSVVHDAVPTSLALSHREIAGRAFPNPPQGPKPKAY